MLHLKKLNRTLIKLPKRLFSQANDISRVPLSESLGFDTLPSAGKQTSSEARNAAWHSTQITRLENGLTVVTEPHFGQYCTIGVAINSGSRFEYGYPFGISHVIEKMAFGSSQNFPSRNDIFAVLEKSGGIIDCQTTRDTAMFAASCHVNGVDSLVDILANAVWKPNINDEEVKAAATTASYEIEDLKLRIDCAPLIADYIHQAAFSGNTLGYSKYVTEETARSISVEQVATYLSQIHTPERMVVAGVGVDHETFVLSVKHHFNQAECTWNKNPEFLLPKVPEIDNSLAQYTGGEFIVPADLSKVGIGTPYPLLAHVVLGFESVSYTDDDFVPFCVLQSLLGGGGSFSAGGPGKGMYARLYTDVMNRCPWIYSATAQNHSYADAGVFTIHASCPPQNLNDALIVITDQFLRLQHGTEREELERAKTQLKSHLMMNLEVRPVLFEDLARQVLGHGTRKTPDEYVARIEKVTNNDIIRIADKMLSSKASFAAYGEVDTLSPYKKIEEAAAKRTCKPLFPNKYW